MRKVVSSYDYEKMREEKEHWEKQAKKWMKAFMRCSKRELKRKEKK